MADYFPLIGRALDTMTDRGPTARNHVYDRARTALTRQLRSLDPPLSAAEFEREAGALDDAIARAEAAYGHELDPEPEAAPGIDHPAGDEPHPARTDDPSPAERAAPSPVIRPARRRRPVALATALAVIVLPVATYAWLQRNRTAAPTQPIVAQPVAPAAPAATGESKFADRIGGPGSAQPGPAQPRGAPPAGQPARIEPGAPPAQASTAPRAEPPAAAPGLSAPASPETTAQPGLVVAQRAVLVEEEPTDPQQPRITGGRAVWRLDALNAGQGQPLESVIRTTVDFPDGGLSMTMLTRKNSDPAFPASHTIEFTFTLTGDPPRVVRDVAPPQLKPDESTRGTPLAGLSVPVKDNISLVGLSDLRSDTERNTDLLLNRNWLDIPIRFASGRRAVISFEKGVSGERVVADAFRQWAVP